MIKTIADVKGAAKARAPGKEILNEDSGGSGLIGIGSQLHQGI
jgi:hypothetical protein